MNRWVFAGSLALPLAYVLSSGAPPSDSTARVASAAEPSQGGAHPAKDGQPQAAGIGKAAPSSPHGHDHAAHDRFLAAEAIEVRPAEERLPRGPLDPAWRAVSPAQIELAAQRTVLLMDRDANAHRHAPPVQADVRALSDGRALALHVSWPDPTYDRAKARGTRSFGDSVAIEIPLDFGEGKRLPYIGMGDPDAHVLVSIARAARDYETGDDTVRALTYVGAGFGSLTRAEVGWMKSSLRYDHAEKRWNGMFVRPWTTKDHDIAKHLVPVAFAVWDGSKSHRGGNKYISRWKFVHDRSRKTDHAYEEQLTFGFHEGDVGDPAKGLEVMALCAGCHRFPGYELAPPQLAPELSNIGVISTYQYLKDSILEPSQIIVPVLNLNRHYDTSGDTDRHGAHPNNMVYQWFSTEEDGTKSSRMPRFEQIDDDQLADLIAYLKTLGTAEGK